MTIDDLAMTRKARNFCPVSETLKAPQKFRHIQTPHGTGWLAHIFVICNETRSEELDPRNRFEGQAIGSLSKA